MGPSPVSPCRVSPPRFWTVSLDSLHRLILLRRNLRLDLDGFDLDELSRLVNAFIVGIPPSALLGGPGWALLLWLKGEWAHSCIADNRLGGKVPALSRDW